MIKLTKKLITIFGSILLLSCTSYSNSGNEVKKYPVINDTRKKIASQRFNCNGKEFIVLYITADKIQLIDKLSNSSFQLDQVISASGLRYSDGKNEIHIKGNNAILNQGGNNISCYIVK